MSTSEAEEAKLDGALQFSTDLKELFAELKASKMVTIDRHPAYLLLGINPGHPPVELYFSQESGLLLRLVRYTDSELGVLPTEVDYSDYRDAATIRIPFHWSVARPAGRFSVQIDEIHENVAIDDATFSLPRKGSSELPTTSP